MQYDLFVIFLYNCELCVYVMFFRVRARYFVIIRCHNRYLYILCVSSVLWHTSRDVSNIRRLCFVGLFYKCTRLRYLSRRDAAIYTSIRRHYGRARICIKRKTLYAHARVQRTHRYLSAKHYVNRYCKICRLNVSRILLPEANFAFRELILCLKYKYSILYTDILHIQL